MLTFFKVNFFDLVPPNCDLKSQNVHFNIDYFLVLSLHLQLLVIFLTKTGRTELPFHQTSRRLLLVLKLISQQRRTAESFIGSDLFNFL